VFCCLRYPPAAARNLDLISTIPELSLAIQYSCPEWLSWLENVLLLKVALAIGLPSAKPLNRFKPAA
jgi:hypothetical protein